MDEETILYSIRKTNRGLVVHEDKVFADFGGEIVSLINEKAFQDLDAPVKRIGSKYTPVGFNRILEKAILVNSEDIYQGMKEALEY